MPTRRPPPALRVRLALLLGICAFAMLNEVSAPSALAPAVGVLFLLWLALAWQSLVLVGQLTVAVALGLAAFMWARGDLSGDLLAAAIGRAAFFTWFLLAMDILRTAAMRSAMVLRSGRALVDQPPGRRYAMLTLGTHVLAMLLNMGAITLLGTMTRRSVARKGASDSAARNEIRLRRMTLGISRGFAAFTLWVPTSVSVLVVLAAIPGFEWHQFALQGMATAATFMALGWLVDRLGHPVLRTHAGPAVPLNRVLRILLPMVLLTLAVLGVAVLLSWISGLRMIAALLISVPCFGLGWTVVQYRTRSRAGALHLAGRRIWRHVLPELTTLHNEVAILAAAGFIAVLLPQQIDTDALGRMVAASGLSTGLILVGLVWLIALGAPVGLNPIITVAVGLELLARMPGLDATPQMLALAGTLGWGLATGLSPLGASMRVTGRCIGRAPSEIGLIWNRRFTLVAGLATSIFLLLFA